MPINRFGVIGHPVAHSKSPLLHRAAFGALGLPLSYDLCDVAPGGLSAFISGLSQEWGGFSVTMPHKVDALELSDDVDLIARVTNAVNTLVLRRSADGQIVNISGYNTDVHGIVASFADADATRARHAAVIGSGATSASAIFALAEMGVEHVSILARNIDKAQDLLSVASEVGLSFSAHTLDQMRTLDAIDVALCALPGDVELSLAALPRTHGAVLLDVAYEPWPSARGAEWEAVGGFAISGLRMLAHQAVIQDRLFINGDASVPLEDEEVVSRTMFESIGLVR
jgi:shikimate dehydrogenase